MQGTLLNQRYRIIKILGAGGFGQTYLANDLCFPDSLPCVVKQFKPASTDKAFLEVARRLFDTEATILERLGQHELIPTFIASFEENKEFYLVQEFIDGKALSDAFADGEEFTESDAIAFLNDVLSVLDFVHRNDVIHRDVKPENIIRRHSDGRYVLIDFGAVKEKQYQLATQTRMTNLPGRSTSADRKTGAFTVGIGTEGYTPHEQLSGRPRHSSDIYALGVTTIQALTGMQPYEWGDDPDTGELQWQPYALTSLGFSLILETMVRFNIKHRYRNASEVLSDLKKLATLPEEYTAIPDPEMNALGDADISRKGARAAVPSDLFAHKIKPPKPTARSRWAKLMPLGVIGSATLFMGGLVLGARQLGWLQPLELAAYDHLVQLRSNFGTDSRVVVVEITEADLRELQQATPSDANVTQVLQTLDTHNPSVVGIDLYRDLPQGPVRDHQTLIDEIESSGAIVVEFLGQGDDHIPPPPGIPDTQIGFADLTTDVDGVLRRNVLIVSDETRSWPSFSFQLATRYLTTKNIEPEEDPQISGQMLLGTTSLPRLSQRSGQYHQLEYGGYQIVLDYRASQQAVRTVRFTDVLTGNFNPEWVTDNIVLIGTTATSSRDRFLTPYSANQRGEESDAKMSGVIIHAQMVSQLLDIALGTRTLRWYWPEPGEVLWIVGWTVAGSSLAYYFRHPIVLGSGGIVLVLTIAGVSFVLFGQGGWIPTLTPAIAALLSGGTAIACRAYLTQKKQDLLSDFLNNTRMKGPS